MGEPDLRSLEQELVSSLRLAAEAYRQQARDATADLFTEAANYIQALQAERSEGGSP